MGFKRAFVHRFAEKMQELAFDGVEDKLDDSDVNDILNALFEISKPLDDDLAELAVEIYCCRMGGMYEAFQELPEVLDAMEEAIARYRGFDTLDAYLADRAGLERLKSKAGTTIYIEA